MPKVSLGDARRLAKRCILTNILDNSDINITTVLRGPAGTGKSQTCGSALAKELNGDCVTVSKNTLKEGEITGLPILSASRNDKKHSNDVLEGLFKLRLADLLGSELTGDNDKDNNVKLQQKKLIQEAIALEFRTSQDNEDRNELIYAKYYVIKRFQELEAFYYNQLLEKPARKKDELPEAYEQRTAHMGGGMLKGRLVIKEDGLLYYDGKCVVDEKQANKITRKQSQILNGNDNKYSILKLIPGNLKLKLLESGEMSLVILFIDELNRGSLEVMQELMNICLNKTINGYDLPWFVQIVAAINPSDKEGKYATIEFDEAHADRFLILDVYADATEFFEYAGDSGLPNTYMSALALNPNLLSKEYSVEDTTTYSPRAHTMCATILKYLDSCNNCAFFTDAEKEEKVKQRDFETLVRAKIGDTAATALLGVMKDATKQVDIFKEILEPKTISKETLAKMNTKEKNTGVSKSYVSYLISSILRELDNNMSKYLSTKENVQNMEAKLFQIIDVLDETTAYLYGKIITSDKYLNSNNGNSLFLKFYKTIKNSDILTKNKNFGANLEAISGDETKEEDI